jgi:hypothetical protein
VRSVKNHGPGNSMPTKQSDPQPVAFGAILLLVFACFLYLIVMGIIHDSRHSDAAGRGLDEAFAAIFGFVLWVVLGALLLIGAIKGKMPKWAKIAAVILLPLSAVAASVAVGLTADHPKWPLYVPTLLPPLIAFYAMWARLPALRRIFPEMPTGVAIWGAVLVLTFQPLAVTYKDSLPDPVRDARIEAEAKAYEEQRAREYAEQLRSEAERYARLNPDSSLGDYLEYLGGGDPRSRQALQGARQVKSRQTDTVTLLNDEKISALRNLWDLDVKATPEVCDAYRSALIKRAARIDKSKPNYLGEAIDAEQHFDNIKWLISEHCDLNDVLDVLAKNIKEVSDSPRLDKTAADFAALRQPR